MEEGKPHTQEKLTRAQRKEQIVERRNKVLELKIDGLSLRKIAKQVGVSHATVVKDLDIVLDELATQRKHLAEKHVDLELQSLTDIMYEVRNVLKRARDAEDPEEPESSRQARVLAAADRLVKLAERKAKLLGLDAPEKMKIDLSSKVSKMSDEELDKIINPGVKIDRTGDDQTS